MVITNLLHSDSNSLKFGLGLLLVVLFILQLLHSCICKNIRIIYWIHWHTDFIHLFLKWQHCLAKRIFEASQFYILYQLKWVHFCTCKISIHWYQYLPIWSCFLKLLLKHILPFLSTLKNNNKGNVKCHILLIIFQMMNFWASDFWKHGNFFVIVYIFYLT